MGSTGFIQSENYPQPYPDNLDKTYVINVESGKQVEVNFETFSLEVSNCLVLGEILTFNAGSPPVLLGLAGGERGVRVHSLGQDMWLQGSV